MLLSGLLIAVLSLTTAQLSAATSFYISTDGTADAVRPLEYDPGSSVVLSSPLQPALTGSFQWLHDEQPLTNATGPTLTLVNLSSADSGNYRLRVSSGQEVTLSENTITLNVIAPPPTAIDPSFTAGIPTDLDLTVYPVFQGASDGSLIVQCFPKSETYDHGTSRRAIRLFSNGVQDPSFNVILGSSSILVVLRDGSMITTEPPFRFASNGSPSLLSLPAGFDPSKTLTGALAQPDGKFLLSQQGKLARFNTDGSLDSSFASALVYDSIQRLRLDSAGRILVYAVNNDTRNFVWYGFLDRLTTTGQRDTTFHVRSGGREWYTPAPLPGGGLLLEYFWSNYEGPIFVRMTDDGTPIPGWSAPGYDSSFANLSVDSSRSGVLWTRDLRRLLLTATGWDYDPTFYPGIVGSLAGILPDGNLLAIRSTATLDGKYSQQLVRLRTNVAVGSLPPNASISPVDTTPHKGTTLTFSSAVNGTGPFTYQWLALDGQPLPADTTSAQLTIANVSAANFGRYQLRLTGPGGVNVLSNVTRAIFAPQQSYLANLSGRAANGEGENSVIAGLSTKISAGALGLPTLLRGVGPALQPLGVANFLPNPAIDLYDAAGQLIGNNDQWSVDPAVPAATSAAGAFSFATGSNDAALLHTFPTGNATLRLKSQGADSGIGLLEIYPLFPNGYEYLYQSLTNLSFRARTAPGEETATAGFVIVDPQGFDRPVKVLLRAIGPTLGSFGIQHPLANSILTVYNSKGETVATNDDWAVNNSSADTATLTAAMKQVGAFDLTADSKDSALLLNLPAGAYSMQATGGSGVVLLEIYLVK